MYVGQVDHFSFGPWPLPRYMRRKSKLFQAQLGQFDPKKLHAPLEAFELLKKLSYEQFDASVEVHVKTGIDPKKGDQQVRGAVTLPHGTGKTKKIAVFAEGDKALEAKEAGADVVGGPELIATIVQTGKADFDIAIATPDMMRHLAAAARVLGPRGLMPSPKNETVTPNVKGAIEQIKKGKENYKNDDTANVHQNIGKRSFETQKLLENYAAFLDSLKKARPSAAKGTYIKSITVASSMGPGIKIQVS